jgi:hypothetical protein
VLGHGIINGGSLVARVVSEVVGVDSGEHHTGDPVFAEAFLLRW